MVGVELTFLGTGGGRFATITQKRWTGGIHFAMDKFHMQLDPGPGALVHSIEQKLNPMKVNAVLVSHSHPDHYTDAEIFIEAMTRGTMNKRGSLVGSHSVLFGSDICEAAISKYHQNLVEEVVEGVPGREFALGEVGVTPTKAVHSDPDAIGFRFEFPDVGVVGYTSDTQYFDGISNPYVGNKLLILCTMRPRGAPWRYHMSTEDAVKIVSEAKPEMAVITHFGTKMLFRGPAIEAKYIERETGVRTIAAVDGMRIRINKGLQVLSGMKRTQRGLSEFWS